MFILDFSPFSITVNKGDIVYLTFLTTTDSIKISSFKCLVLNLYTCFDHMSSEMFYLLLTLLNVCQVFSVVRAAIKDTEKKESTPWLQLKSPSISFIKSKMESIPEGFIVLSSVAIFCPNMSVQSKKHLNSRRYLSSRYLSRSEWWYRCLHSWKKLLANRDLLLVIKTNTLDMTS